MDAVILKQYLNFSRASAELEISSLRNTSLSEYRDLATMSSSCLVSAWIMGVLIIQDRFEKLRGIDVNN